MTSMVREESIKKTSSSKYRILKGPEKRVEDILFFALVIVGSLWMFDVYFYFGLTPMIKQYIGVFLAFSLGGIFLTVPFR
ncbi:MAG TPA: hypothetical protein ENO25_05890, partial [Desulfobacteraceae bacterium]|nr:hypothetical protein [Desulfobacteraceae bacterium]